MSAVEDKNRFEREKCVYLLTIQEQLERPSDMLTTVRLTSKTNTTECSKT